MEPPREPPTGYRDVSPGTHVTRNLVLESKKKGTGIPDVKHLKWWGWDVEGATEEQLAALAASGIAVCPTLGGFNTKSLPALAAVAPRFQQIFADAGLTPESFLEIRMSALRQMTTFGIRLTQTSPACGITSAAKRCSATPGGQRFQNRGRVCRRGPPCASTHRSSPTKAASHSPSHGAWRTGLTNTGKDPETTPKYAEWSRPTKRPLLPGPRRNAVHQTVRIRR